MSDKQRGHTDKQLLIKGLKRLALALPLLVLTTYLFTFTFLNKETIPMYYILPLAILGMAGTIFTLFSGIKLVLKSMFH
jgi:small-conductance mechanosensitive channel|tara:strand:+ start:248 stop:484 length:237 start_codon:yes stop_codon:yes gene_type:complete